MANQWFKFYGGEYLSDPKIERLSPVERSCWVTLLCLASMTSDGVVEFLTIESLLNKSGIQFNPYAPEEWEKSLSVLQKFQKMKMIELLDNGDIKLLNWEKRQEHNMTPAERMAKMRANKVKTEVVTTNVTNVTSDKNRIEENIETENLSDFTDSSRKEVPEEEEDEITVEECDEDGLPIPKKKPKANKADSKLAQVKEIRAKFSVLCQKYCKVTPIFAMKDQVVVLSYLSRFNPDHLDGIFNWWFRLSDKPEEALPNLNQCLSNYNLGLYQTYKRVNLKN